MSALEGRGWIAPSHADYVVDYDGTTHLVWQTIYGEMRFRPDLSDANADTAIENCMADTANRIVIFCTGRVDGVGRTLTISRSAVTITTGLHFQLDTSLVVPRFERILLDSNAVSGGIKYIKIEGFSMNTLDFFGNTTAIVSVVIQGCGIRPTAAGEGIRFRGDGFIDHVDLIKCTIHDFHDESVDNEGAIYFANSNDGTGQIRFESLRYHDSTEDNTVMCCFDSGRVGTDLIFDYLSMAVFGTGFVGFKVKSGAWISSVKIQPAWIEPHDDLTFIVIDNGAQRFRMFLNQSDWSIADGIAVTLLTNNNPNGTWSTNPVNGLFGDTNVMWSPSTGTFSEGTLARGTNFHVDIGYFYKTGVTDVPKVRKHVTAGGTDADLATNGTAEYFTVEGASTAVGVANVFEPYLVRTYDVIYRHMSVLLDTAPGAGNSRTFTLYVNGAPTALTVTVANAATTGTDFTNEVTVAARVPHCWESDGGVSDPTAAMVKISAEMLFMEREGL